MTSLPRNLIRASAYPAIDATTTLMRVWLNAMMKLLRAYVANGAAFSAST